MDATPKNIHNGGRTETGTMQAIIHARFGAPAEALELHHVPVPTPGEDDVLIEVQAAGVAIGDWLTIKGVPYIARPMFGIRTPKQRVAGFEVAGRVVGVGSGVTRFAVGDEVLGWGKGTLAELVTLSQDALAPKPENITAVQAAAVPISGFAALQALRDAGRVQRGQKVLIVGASGAVGTHAVQIAKALGAVVTAVVSTRNVDMVRSIGADHVVDYTRADIADGGARYDVILDLAGNRSVRHLRRVLSPTGTLVLVGGSGGSWTMGFGRTIGAMALNPFVRQTLVSFLSKGTREDLVVLADMLESGALIPVIDRTYPLAQTVEALEHVGSRHTQGKTVVTVGGQ